MQQQEKAYGRITFDRLKETSPPLNKSCVEQGRDIEHGSRVDVIGCLISK